MRLKKGCSGIWIAALAAIADRIAKAIVLSANARRLALSSTDSSVLWKWPGVAALRYAENTGIAFSLFSGSGAALTVFTLLLVSGLAGTLISKPEMPKAMRAGFWLIIGGGMGNLFDRLVYGYVIDFIEVLFVRFAVFNLADAFICIGAAVVAIAALIDERKKELHP